MIYVILFLIVLIELEYKPRLDITNDKKLILWYGIRDRRFIKLL